MLEKTFQILIIIMLHKLLLEIDDILLASIGETPHSEIFGIKTNSLFGDMSKLRGYNSV